MAAEKRSVEFQSVLRTLLDNEPFAKSRKKLARAIGVGDATISHYLGGRIKPSFETLLAIAEFFNVPLDYLVYGERPRVSVEDDPAGLREQIRRAMVEANDLSGRHLDMVARISRRLQATIDEAARELAKRAENSGPVGFVTYAEAIALESCIKSMRIMTRVFKSDVDDGQPGAFLEVVASNLKAGHPYEYLLYGDRDTWQRPVEDFRRLVRENGVPGEIAQQNLHFRYLRQELISSVCILELDLPRVMRQEPILWARHSDNISAEGIWAYLSIERDDAQGGVTIEPAYLTSTLRQFSRDWGEARPI